MSKSTTVTVEKLQSFIEAVIFAADLPEDQEWVPTPRQWKKIYQMIESLETVAPAPAASPVQYAQPQFQAPVQYAPSAMPPSFAPAPTQIPAGVPIAAQEGMTVRTPDVDTSTGSYNSGFA